MSAKVTVKAKNDVYGKGLYDAYGNEVGDMLFLKGEKYVFDMQGLRICGIDELGLPHIFKGLNDKYLLENFDVLDVEENINTEPIPKGKRILHVVPMDESKFFAWCQWDHLKEQFGMIYNHNMKYILEGTGFTYKDLRKGGVWEIAVDRDVWEKCSDELTYARSK